RDGRASAKEPAPDARSADGGKQCSVVAGVVIEDAGHEENNHQDDGRGYDDAEEDLGGFAVLLKETDHAWLTTFTSKRAVGRSRVPGDFCAECASLAARHITPVCRGFLLSINQRRGFISGEEGGSKRLLAKALQSKGAAKSQPRC